jgi:hypothetical protein
MQQQEGDEQALPEASTRSTLSETEAQRAAEVMLRPFPRSLSTCM